MTDYKLQIKIIRSLGYAIGLLDGVMLNDISENLKVKLCHAQSHLNKELDEIMKEFQNE